MCMSSNSSRARVQELVAKAGITIGGSQPYDITVHDERFYTRVLLHGSLGLGEAYMDGWWDCQRVDMFVDKLITSKASDSAAHSWKFIASYVAAVLFNQQRRSRAFVIGETHYDIGNDLFERMLDAYMQYSCGYWANAKNLGEAQEAKLNLICKKLYLEKGQRLLDIGCGWGGLARFAAQQYGVSVDGYTVSKEQAAYAEERAQGMPIRFFLEDYRSINERYDRIVSVGMFEHVGYKNYRTYFEVARRALKEDGIMLLHTIGGDVTTATTDPWIQKYIFRSGMIPSMKQITTALEGLFVVEDWHNFGADYDKTLMAWYANFRASWGALSQNKNYTERFRRMWEYYLLACAGAFRARGLQLWQVALSPKGVRGGYRSVR